MNTREAYNEWSSQYDSNENKTRDLEARALRELLAEKKFTACLEIGCGTGKNSVWLAERSSALLGVDLSDAMLAVARKKINSPHVKFVEADITEPWDFATARYDLVVYSLVLEHISALEDIFKKTVSVLENGGYVYIGELHPFKQYAGSKARFNTEKGEQQVTCYTHNVSEYINLGTQFGLKLAGFREYFDEGDSNEIPRILALLFVKD